MFFTVALEPVLSEVHASFSWSRLHVGDALKTRYIYVYKTSMHVCEIYTNRQKARRNGFLQVNTPGPLLATQTNFGNQKWSGVGLILAAKSGPQGPIFARTNFRVTGPLGSIFARRTNLRVTGPVDGLHSL